MENNQIAAVGVQVVAAPNGAEFVAAAAEAVPAPHDVVVGAQVVRDGPQNAVINDPDGNGDEIIESSRLKSVVWNHFTRIKVKDVLKAKCKHCRKLLCGQSKDGTSHLKNHMRTCLQKIIGDMTQKVLGATYAPIGNRDLVVSAYNSEICRRELAAAILVHEYPLSMVDHLYFKRFICSLQPLFSIPSRNTIKKDILKLYESERSRIQKVIDNNRGRVALTTDMWTALTQKKGYMAVTAHYIDNSWKLRSHMLRFMYVPAPHTSERLATIMAECMMDWNVDSKVSTITLDNCSTNDSMIDKIKQKLMLPYLMLDGSMLHMRCSAHILNLIVKDGLLLLKDGIERIREFVVYWSATPKRKEFFEETARQLRIGCDTHLVLDCPTRWNSTYQMLASALPYKDVFSRLKQRDSQYNCLPTHSDWQFSSIVCSKLEIFNEMSKLFSGEHYPTANLFFPRVCDLKMKLSEWLLDSDFVINQMASSMWLKFKKYWEDIHELLAVAIVLDPRYKLEIISYYCAKFGTADIECSLDGDKIKTILVDLLREYKTRMEMDSPSAANANPAPSKSGIDLDFAFYVSQRKRSKTVAYQTELDRYLSEDVIPCSDDFGILTWWQQNGIKYPVLQEIARDILAVPITSVASESAFSSGGRLLDPHRSRLLPSTVEAMMCARSWLKAEVIKDNVNVATDALEGCFSMLNLGGEENENGMEVEEDISGRSAYLEGILDK